MLKIRDDGIFGQNRIFLFKIRDAVQNISNMKQKGKLHYDNYLK